jgi:hypothetical protein
MRGAGDTRRGEVERGDDRAGRYVKKMKRCNGWADRVYKLPSWNLIQDPREPIVFVPVVQIDRTNIHTYMVPYQRYFSV